VWHLEGVTFPLRVAMPISMSGENP
jgi:hypothetical protein